MMKLLFICLVALGVVASESLVTYPTPDYVGDWQAVQHAQPRDMVSFTVVLQERNMEAVRQLALVVSDPDSPKYGQYLQQEQLDAMTMPDKEDLDRVLEWLRSNDIKPTVKRHNVLVSCTVARAEKLLSTQFSVMVSKSHNATLIRAGDYALPIAVQFSISTIFGLHGIPKPIESPVGVGAAPADVTPAVLESTYKVGGVDVSRSTTNRQAVAEFQGQEMSQPDLSTFFHKYVPTAHDGDELVYKYVGDDKNQTGEGVEALLDIQYIMGVAPGVKTEFWEWKSNDFCGDLHGWSSEILSETDGPNVHSVSYGWQGDTTKIGCNDADKAAVEDNFAKIATRGISILFASGDSGSGYAGTLFQKAMYPSWPASSPWITAVGATRFVNQEPGQPEMATDQFGSGGGFSAHFKQSPNAEWQTSFVKNYLNTVSDLPDAKLYDPTGRATPDVSALGEGYQVIVGGRANAVGGTSASTPAFAGLVSLLNEARAQAGKAPLGFLNPFLYKNADAFTDVTLGDNKVGRGGETLKEGWVCAKGWDPATGLGTPIFSKLLTAALALP